MVKFLDEDGLSKLVNNIKTNCKEWSKSTKKREQIIIGKAIRIKSCDVKDAENWYVQNLTEINSVSINIPKSYQGYRIIIYYRAAGEENYTRGTYNWDRAGDVGILTLSNKLGFTKWKVDKYATAIGNNLLVWLTYKNCPNTIRGMGTRYEYLNGRKVWNHNFTINDLRGLTLQEIADKYPLYHRRTYYRNKKRRWVKSNIKNLRWRWYLMNENWKPRAGLYRAICVDKKRSYTISVDFYYTRSGMIKKR